MKAGQHHWFRHAVGWSICLSIIVVTFLLIVFLINRKQANAVESVPSTSVASPDSSKALKNLASAESHHSAFDRATSDSYQDSHWDTPLPDPSSALEQRLLPYDPQMGKPYDVPLEEWENGQKAFGITDPETTQAGKEAGQTMWYFDKHGEL